MAEWSAALATARDVLFKSTGVQVAVALGCAVVLLAPDAALHVMGLDAVREQHRAWFGSALLVVTDIDILHGSPATRRSVREPAPGFRGDHGNARPSGALLT